MSVEKIEELYERFLRSKRNISSIIPHLPYLRSLGDKCDHITNLGVDHGCSTVAFLASSPSTLVAVDIVRPRIVNKIESVKDLKTKFKFIQGDSRKIDLDETDLLFIDTTHTYEHLKEELRKQASIAKRYIVFHDTDIAWKTGFWFRHERLAKKFGEGISVGDKGERLESKGLGAAIKEFLSENPNWKVEYKTPRSAGLMTLVNERN